jgi:diacylglycerol kinase (ATP)
MKRLINSFGFAIKGIVTIYREGQINIRIHTLIAIVTICLSVFFSIACIEWIIVILCIGTVIAAEMLNTAIEKLVDLVAPEWSEAAGKIKDIAAGAVLVVSIAAGITGCIIFVPKILALF